MTAVGKLEKTRIAMQQETSTAYLSALRVVGKLETERDALRELLEEVRPIIAETQTFDGHTTDTPSGLLARIDAAINAAQVTPQTSRTAADSETTPVVAVQQSKVS